MAGYVTDIEERTLRNEHFREVIFTGPHIQLVLMTLRPGEEIGSERHDEHDQFIRVEEGHGEVVLGVERHALTDGSAVVIPAGVQHNVVNLSGDRPLRLYTLYSPPEHADRTMHHTKADADAAEHRG